MNTIVPIIAILCSGLMSGLLFGDWLGPSYARAEMSVSSFVQFQQIVHLQYLRVLPALSSIALAAPSLWLILSRAEWGTVRFGILLAGTVAILAGFSITFLYNVPVNRHLERWDYAAPPANAREIWRSWETAHVVRTVLWSLGFILEIIVLSQPRS